MNVDDFMPNKNPELTPITDRIPPGWGKWIDVGPGWYDIVINLNKEIARILPDYEVHQVKEKFGGLRYYCYPYTERVESIVRAAERKAAKTCEVCGEPAVLKISENYWYKTICDSCDKENRYVVLED